MSLGTNSIFGICNDEKPTLGNPLTILRDLLLHIPLGQTGHRPRFESPNLGLGLMAYGLGLYQNKSVAHIVSLFQVIIQHGRHM